MKKYVMSVVDIKCLITWNLVFQTFRNLQKEKEKKLKNFKMKVDLNIIVIDDQVKFDEKTRARLSL